MGRGALVLYRNTPENAEVAGDAGIPFEPDELAPKMEQVLAMAGAERAAFQKRAMERVQARYSWDAVTDAYERLLMGLWSGSPDLPARLPASVDSTAAGAHPAR
jgi:glycosyltransferase involved in cell wall biosynthesis